MPPGGFEPPPLPPEGSALSPELWGPRGVNNRSRSGGWSWTARVAPWTCRRHGREARCGPATDLPSARCERRDPVRGSAFRAALQARTTHATSHRTADTARCAAAAGREARCGPATAVPSVPGERRDPVRGSAFRAALQARTTHGSSHQMAERHRASVAIRCEVSCSVRRCKRAPRTQPRTGWWTRHRAWPPPAGRCGAGPPRTSRPHGASVAIPCEVPCSVRRCKRAPRAQPRTRRRTGTVPARPRQPAGVAVADADGCSAARTASTTGCAPPGSVNSVDCAAIQYGSAKASARPTSPLRAK